METKTVQTFDEEQVLDYVVDSANHHTLMMKGMTDEQAGAYLKGVIETNTVVLAIWPDPTHPAGFDVKIVKDAAGLFMGKPDEHVPLSGIACPTEEHADQLVALLELYGPGTSVN